jgi:hypothetical protein
MPPWHRGTVWALKSGYPPDEGLWFFYSYFLSLSRDSSKKSEEKIIRDLDETVSFRRDAGEQAACFQPSDQLIRPHASGFGLPRCLRFCPPFPAVPALPSLRGP